MNERITYNPDLMGERDRDRVAVWLALNGVTAAARTPVIAEDGHITVERFIFNDDGRPTGDTYEVRLPIDVPIEDVPRGAFLTYPDGPDQPPRIFYPERFIP